MFHLHLKTPLTARRKLLGRFMIPRARRWIILGGRRITVNIIPPFSDISKSVWKISKKVWLVGRAGLVGLAVLLAAWVVCSVVAGLAQGVRGPGALAVVVGVCRLGPCLLTKRWPEILHMLGQESRLGRLLEQRYGRCRICMLVKA